MAKVYFRYATKPAPGERVLVVGETFGMGQWKPERGLELFPDQHLPETWSSQAPLLVPAGVELLYKYVYLSGGMYRWEARKGNRSVHTESKMMIIDDSSDSPYSRVTFQDEDISFVQEEAQTTIDESIKFTPFDSVILTSLLLPLKVRRNEEFKSGDDPSQKWLVEEIPGMWLPVLYRIAVKEHIEFRWVGWPHIVLTNEREQEEVSDLLMQQYNCVPIFFNSEVLDRNFLFCSGILYKLFHDVIETQPESMPQYSQHLWEAYKTVNSQFADKIAELYTGREVILVHDYQLLLLPSFVSRRRGETLNIGLYLHCPFPSSEVFRVLPYREALLHAMLCCDLIGFHSFEYARHFITCCKRMLGVDHVCRPGGYLALEFYGRNVMLRVGYLAIEPELVREVCSENSYQSYLTELRGKYEGKKIFVGIDWLQRLSGIALKLNAFRELLQKAADDNIILIQVCMPTKSTIKEDEQLVEQELSSMCADINREFNRQAVIFSVEDLDRSHRYAYLELADSVVNSSVREGLCLVPFEYYAVKGEAAGTVIVSEFAGVSRALCSVIRVNPFERNALISAMSDAVKVRSRFPDALNRDLGYIRTHTTFKWAHQFLTDLKRARKDTKRFQFVAHGMGDKLKVIALHKDFYHLHEEEVMKAYRAARNRVLLFDNEGTLATVMKKLSGVKAKGPSARNLECLQEICRETNNTVFVITGREKGVLEESYGDMEGLCMAAEYGAFMRWSAGEGWRSYGSHSGLWKETAAEVIRAYVSRTEGSESAIKESSVTFQYRNADPDLGSWQAKELCSHLDVLLRQFMNECEISSGLGYVEVKPRGVNKGTSAYRIMQEVYERKGPIDFVLGIGDDTSDEEMFKVLRGMKKTESSLLAPGTAAVFAVTVGRKPSTASAYVTDDMEVTRLLEVLRSALKRGSEQRLFPSRKADRTQTLPTYSLSKAPK